MDIRPIGVEEWLNLHERDARWDIAQSTFSSLTMGELRALDEDEDEGRHLFERLDRERMNYGWIEGSPAFKHEVSGLYQTEVDPHRILQTNGCTGANLNAILATVGRGDHVIAEYPTYSQLYDLPRALGARVECWHLREELGWQPDIDELRRLARRDTRLICLNNASNPIGVLLDRAMLEQVAEVAAWAGAYVLCDEVYLPLEDAAAFVSMADVYGRAIVTNSVSKTYSLPGARVGWVLADSEVSDRIRTSRDYTMISAGVPNDMLATYVLRNREAVLRRNRVIACHNRSIVQAWIDCQPRAHWVAPRGVSTSYVQLDLPVSDEEFCLDLLARDGVLLVPGSRFGLPSGVRLGYCCDERVLRTGLELVGEALARLDG